MSLNFIELRCHITNSIYLRMFNTSRSVFLLYLKKDETFCVIGLRLSAISTFIRHSIEVSGNGTGTIKANEIVSKFSIFTVTNLRIIPGFLFRI